MPKTKPSEQEARSRETICNFLDAMNRAGYDRHSVCRIMGVERNTFYRRKRDPGSFTLAEIWAMEKACGCKISIPFERKME